MCWKFSIVHPQLILYSSPFCSVLQETDQYKPHYLSWLPYCLAMVCIQPVWSMGRREKCTGRMKSEKCLPLVPPWWAETTWLCFPPKATAAGGLFLNSQWVPLLLPSLPLISLNPVKLSSVTHVSGPSLSFREGNLDCCNFVHKYLLSMQQPKKENSTGSTPFLPSVLSESQRHLHQNDVSNDRLRKAKLVPE